MPSAYAHLHFGNKAIKLMPDSLSESALRYREIFNIGLHGPDIFFFYRPFSDNSIKRLGDNLHDISAKEFFLPTRDIYNLSGKKSEMLAYMLGFLCHYSLDSMCHGYVEKKLSVSSLGHMEIENEFDRYLLEKDGRSAIGADLTSHILPSSSRAAVISRFFKDITPKQIEESLKSMKLYSGFLNSFGAKRALTDAVLKLSGQYRKIGKIMMPKKILVGSEDSNLRLEKLLNKALFHFPSLAKDYEGFLNGGRYPRSMEKTFGPDAGWEKIKVLTFEEEKNYEL